jgi:mannosyltransferase
MRTHLLVLLPIAALACLAVATGWTTVQSIPGLRRKLRFPRSRVTLVLAGITVAAAALRFANLGIQSFWFDEAVTVNLAHNSLRGMLTGIREVESTPPLYYVVAWFWEKVFGHSEVALRSLSALVGTATVPITYLTARRLVSARAALIAAGLVAANPLLIWYSQEARSYALFVLLSTLSLFCCLRAVERPSTLVLAWWAITGGLALETHYFAIFLIVPEVVWLLWSLGGSRAALWATAGIGAVAVTLFPLAYEQEQSGRTSFIAATPFDLRTQHMLRQFLTGVNELPRGWYLTALVLWGVGLVLLAFAAHGGDRHGAAVAFFFAAFGLGSAAVAAALGHDFFYFRNLLFVLIPLAIGISAGFAAEKTRALGLAASVALVAVSMAMTFYIWGHGDVQRDNWRALVKALGSQRADRAVVTSPFWQETALQLYRPRIRHMPSSGADVREIAVVGENVYPGWLRIPRTFGAQTTEHFGRLKLVRYRSSAAYRVSPSLLVRGHDRRSVHLDYSTGP